MTVPDQQRPPLVLITDAHVSRRQGNADAFFRMLEAIADGPADVVFLGDIFDLWIALPRYENGLHRSFLAWCREQKTRRCIGFVEGNHEFFLAQAHPEAFTWCTHLPWWTDSDGNQYCHGDRINRADRSYFYFRKATKNPLARVILKGLPRGPRLVDIVKRHLKHSGRAFRKRLPLDQLRTFAEARFGEGAARIFMGHFHQAFHYRGVRGGELHALPDWFSQGRISVLAPDQRILQQGRWEDLLPMEMRFEALDPPAGLTPGQSRYRL